MSIKLMSWAFGLDIPTNPKFVLIALSERANHDGTSCHPGQQELSQKTSLCIRAIQNNLSWLEKNGYIKKYRRFRKDGYRTSDEYTILTPTLGAADSGELDSRAADSCAANATLGADDDVPYAQPMYTLGAANGGAYIDTVREPSVRLVREPSDSLPEFETFWSNFPKQRIGSKPKAVEAWRKTLRANPDVGPPDLITAVLAYSASDEVARGYAKGCAAWLNDERWRNDYSAKPPDSAKPKNDYFATIMKAVDTVGRHENAC